MKKNSLLKRAAAVLIALILITAVAVLPAHALNGPPSNPTWSGDVALWTAPDPSEGEVSYYVVNVYKDHSYLDSITAYYTSYNLSGTMEINGIGWYTFSVVAVYTDGAKSSSVSSAINKHGYDVHTHTMESHSFSYPTCTEKGCKGYYVCTDCGKWYWDENGDYEITDHDEAFTDPIGHDWGEWKVVKKATTTSEGKAERVCKNDSSHVESYTIPKLKSEDEKPTLPEETKDEKDTKATEATETKATESKATESTASTDATIAKSGGVGNLLKGLLGGGATLILLIIAAVIVLIVIPGVVILIVVLVNKKKKKTGPTDNQPPTNTP